LGLVYLVAYLALAAGAAGGLFRFPDLLDFAHSPQVRLFVGSCVGFVLATVGLGAYLKSSPRWASQGGFGLIAWIFKPLLIIHGGFVMGLLAKDGMVGVLACVGLGIMVHVASEQLISRSGVTTPSTLLRREGQALANWAPAAREGGGGERVDIYCAHPRLGSVPAASENKRKLWDVYREPEALVLGLGTREVIALAPDGRWLLSAGGGKVFLQNMITNQRQVMTGTSVAPAVGAAFYVNRDSGTPSTAVLLVRGDGAVEEWQVSTGSGARRNPLISGGTLTRAWPSPMGDWVAVVDGAGNFLVIYRNGQAARPFPRAVGGNRVTSVSISPEGTRLVVATARQKDEGSDEERGGVIEVGVPDGREAARAAQGRFGLILSSTFSPDGTKVAFCTQKGTVYAWVLAEAGVRRLVEGIDPERGVTFLDEHSVAAFQAGKPVVVPVERRGEERTGQPSQAAPGARVSAQPVEAESGDDEDDEDLGPIKVPDSWKSGSSAKKRPTRALPIVAGGGRLLLGEVDGTISVWDVAGAKQIESREGHRGPIAFLTWDIADKMLYSACVIPAARAALIDAWEVRSKQAGLLTSSAVIHPDARIIPANEWYSAMRVSATGTACAWWTASTLHLVDLGEPGLRTLENEHRGPITSVAMSPDGEEVAVGHDDGILRIWLIENMEAQRAWRAHNGAIDDVHYSHDGKFIITLSSTEGLAVWEAHTAKRVWAAGAAKGGLTTCAIAPRGDRIAVAASDGMVDVWTLKENTSKSLSDLKVAPWALVFGGKGEMLAGADQTGKIGMWDTRSGNWLGAVPFKVIGASALAVRDEPRMLAVGDISGSVRVWGPK